MFVLKNGFNNKKNIKSKIRNWIRSRMGLFLFSTFNSSRLVFLPDS